MPATTIASWNINGIRAITNKRKLEEYVKLHKPDILCLQEVRANLETATKLLIPLGYEYILVNHSKTKKGYSGTAILSHSPPVADISSLSHHNMREADDEGRITAAEFSNFVLVSVYTPNSGAELARLKFRTATWDIKFANYVNELKRKYPNKTVIVVGDLNVAHLDIDIHNPKTNQKSAGFTPQERESYTQILASTNMTDTFRALYPTEAKYSYWSNFGQSRAKGKGWLIDRALVSNMQIVQDSKVHDDVYGSDHAPISLTIK